MTKGGRKNAERESVHRNVHPWTGQETGQLYLYTGMRQKRRGQNQDGRGAIGETTENALALTALAEAVQRITEPCSLRVFTRCEHILNVMGNHWARQWRKNGWRNAKGSPVKHAELWEKALCGLDRHCCLFTDEEHSYTRWMQEELKRNRRKPA